MMMATVKVDSRALAWLSGRAHDGLRPRLAIVRPPDPKKVAEAVDRLRTHLWTAEFFEDRREDTLVDMTYYDFHAMGPLRRAVQNARRDLSWEPGSTEAKRVLVGAMLAYSAAAARFSGMRADAERQATEADWNREEYERILKEYAKDVALEADRRTRALPNPFRQDPVAPRDTEARFRPSGMIMRVPAAWRTPARRAVTAPVPIPGTSAAPASAVPAPVSAPAAAAPQNRPASGGFPGWLFEQATAVPLGPITMPGTYGT